MAWRQLYEVAKFDGRLNANVDAAPKTEVFDAGPMAYVVPGKLRVTGSERPVHCRPNERLPRTMRAVQLDVYDRGS